MQLFLKYRERKLFVDELTNDSDCNEMEIDWELISCHLNDLDDKLKYLKPKNLYCFGQEYFNIDFKVKKGTKVHVVYVRYNSGGSFSKTYGDWKIVGIYEKEDEAEKVKKSIYDGSFKGHKPWVGYFESLTYCEVETLTVEK